jgi:hypothetical protein
VSEATGPRDLAGEVAALREQIEQLARAVEARE